MTDGFPATAEHCAIARSLLGEIHGVLSEMIACGMPGLAVLDASAVAVAVKTTRSGQKFMAASVSNRRSAAGWPRDGQPMGDVEDVFPPDRLSEWTLPPGEVEPVRVFDTADDALALLARLSLRSA